jgi:predicted ATP-binding protein involved in virulence
LFERPLIDYYTIKKVKYLGRFENQKYQEILHELKKNNNDFLSNFDKNEMEKELLDYVKILI